jgi:hypothetical protein
MPVTKWMYRQYLTSGLTQVMSFQQYLKQLQRKVVA